MAMMNVHEDALNAGGALYHEFLLRFRKESKTVYGIVEGKDDPLFYRGLVEQKLLAGWEIDFLIAGNRDKVLRAESEFDWNRFDKGRICFFVDRDLSSFAEILEVPFDNLYITDGYSIENELANFGAVKRVITELLNVTEISPGELLLMRRSFDDNLKAFSEIMTPIMAQILIWKRAKARTSLDNISPKDIFEFQNGVLKTKAGFESVADRLKYVGQKVQLPPSPAAEVAIVVDEFLAKEGALRFVRGKYVAWFVVEQCLHFHVTIRNYCKSYTASPKVRVTLGQANAMALVATRIRCPASLDIFVKSTYCEFILGPTKTEEKVLQGEMDGTKSSWRRVLGALSSTFEKLFRQRKSS